MPSLPGGEPLRGRGLAHRLGVGQRAAGDIAIGGHPDGMQRRGVRRLVELRLRLDEKPVIGGEGDDDDQRQSEDRENNRDPAAPVTPEAGEGQTAHHIAPGKTKHSFSRIDHDDHQQCMVGAASVGSSVVY